ncbi:MAG: DUF6455 family protein [Woeseiaceae bacterium]
MNTTLSDIGIAILFVAVAAALVVWFRSKLAADSSSRLRRMMARYGLDPDKVEATDAGTGLDMQAVRKRCRRCPAEDECERWLAGEIEGDNGFCPNARIFDGIVKPG